MEAFTNMSAVLVLTSCNDFLDKYPKYGVDPESEVTNEIAVALTTACYKTLQSSNMYNQRIWSLDIIAGNSEVGAGGGTDGLETVQASNFIAQSDNGFALYVWRSPWVGIGPVSYTHLDVYKRQELETAYFEWADKSDVLYFQKMWNTYNKNRRKDFKEYKTR